MQMAGLLTPNKAPGALPWMPDLEGNPGEGQAEGSTSAPAPPPACGRQLGPWFPGPPSCGAGLMAAALLWSQET